MFFPVRLTFWELKENIFFSAKWNLNPLDWEKHNSAACVQVGIYVRAYDLHIINVTSSLIENKDKDNLVSAKWRLSMSLTRKLILAICLGQNLYPVTISYTLTFLRNFFGLIIYVLYEYTLAPSFRCDFLLPLKVIFDLMERPPRHCREGFYILTAIIQ